MNAVRAATTGAQSSGRRYFSAQADGCLEDTAVAGCEQVIVCGTEAHVCVQQTALDLRRAGKQVFIVAEASGSRDPANRDLAFTRMRGHGIEIVSREMVAFSGCSVVAPRSSARSIATSSAEGAARPAPLTIQAPGRLRARPTGKRAYPCNGSCA